MFLYTHKRSNLVIFLAVQQTQALLIHDQLPVGWGGWGGVGRGNVHVPVHTQAQQPYHFSQALLIHDQLPVGWGKVGLVTTFMLSNATHHVGPLNPPHVPAACPQVLP